MIHGKTICFEEKSMNKELKCGCRALIKELKDKFWIHSLFDRCSNHDENWYIGKSFGNLEVLFLFKKWSFDNDFE